MLTAPRPSEASRTRRRRASIPLRRAAAIRWRLRSNASMPSRASPRAASLRATARSLSFSAMASSISTSRFSTSRRASSISACVAIARRRESPSSLSPLNAFNWLRATLGDVFVDGRAEGERMVENVRRLTRALGAETNCRRLLQQKVGFGLSRANHILEDLRLGRLVRGVRRVERPDAEVRVRHRARRTRARGDGPTEGTPELGLRRLAT